MTPTTVAALAAGDLVFNDRPRPHSHYWCHKCRDWQPCDHDGDIYVCSVCGEAILCDECGSEWTDDHRDH